MSIATVTHAVCSVDDLPSVGSRFLVEVDGVSLAVFRLSDGFYALENRCPHQGGPICTGNLFRQLTAEVLPDGEVREYYASDEYNVISCPLHGWECDIRTGEVIADRRRRARTFPVELQGETVHVALPARASA